MEGCEAPLLGESLAGGDNDLGGRHLIRALLNTAAAEEAFGHVQVALVVETDITLEDVLGQGHLAPRHRRFALKSRECRAVGPAGAALHAFFQVFFYSLQRIHGNLRSMF